MRRSLRDAAAVLALALLTGALLLFALLYQREAALRSGEELTDSLSRVISEQTARTIQSVDQTLQLAVVKVEMLRQTGMLSQASAQPMLLAQLKDLPFLRALWVVDSQGQVVLDSEDQSLGRSVADRGYFQAYQRAPATEFFIGPVVRSRTTGGWTMVVARPIRNADGSLRAVLAAAVEPPYFEQLWRGIDLGANGAIVLYHRNGQILARSPADAGLTGRDLSHTPLFTQYLLHAPEGTYIRESSIDGVLRVVSYRTLPTYPDLVVSVGSSYEAMLLPWRRFATLSTMVWAVAVLVAIVLTGQLRRQARSRERTEQRFQQLAQAMPQIVFTADERGAVQFVSRRWMEVTGEPMERALGNRWQELVHPADRQEMVRRLAEMVASGRELQFEHRLRYRDGQYRWQLLRAAPVREEDSPAIQWFGSATDIDALKRAQEQLREQAERLRVAGRLTRMGHWRADLASQRVLLSEQAAAVLDLPPGAEPTVQELLAMVKPHSLPKAVDGLNNCVEKGLPFDIEAELQTGSGRQMWVRSVGEPVHDDEGRIVAIEGAQQDITLRVLMMEEIRRLNASLEERIADRTSQLTRQEALFRTLAEQAPLPFWTVDPRGQTTFLSRAWYELVGGAPPDWLGYGWLKLLHPDDVQPVQENWLRSAPTGEPYSGTRRIRACDGSYHTTSYRALPVRGEQGDILFWVGVDTDITDLVANQEALRLANRQLESFSYSVSHDLQSPLQRVSSYARLLEQELAPLPEGRAHHYLQRIQANAASMSELIEGLLALAHVSELEVIRAVVNLSELASEILLRLQSEQPQRRVGWRVEPGLAVMADARLMRSVLENLIGNAWKFTSRQPAAEIVVGGMRDRGEYFVRDNGCGFDMAYADRLFGTFQRLHGSDEYPGTGIGLATVARAISRQGGQVWAHSRVGEGATFCFTLPPA
ncbi:PAS domain-containing protein [Ramlibacter sp.]|uniref:PAS domain-containing protein n=1 Tax=Ramlibacter sp. TaxID=1917967 RepID=UPI0026074518|nr:PAS domain-containing protein [Ramlibacter sp.]MDB5955066.1 multi-sensor signal transduction histidine kinase [Ramlibacter sp.]